MSPLLTQSLGLNSCSDVSDQMLVPMMLSFPLQRGRPAGTSF